CFLSAAACACVLASSACSGPSSCGCPWLLARPTGSDLANKSRKAPKRKADMAQARCWRYTPKADATHGKNTQGRFAKSTTHCQCLAGGTNPPSRRAKGSLARPGPHGKRAGSPAPQIEPSIASLLAWAAYVAAMSTADPLTAPSARAVLEASI